HLDVTFDPAAHDWVVVYNRQTTLDDNDLYAARVSATGEAIEPAGSPVRAAAGAQDFPAVAAGPAGSGGVRVVWVDNIAGVGPTPAPDPQDIYAASLSASGVVSAAAPVSTGAPRQTQPRL